jgi:hypothetical protein
MQAAWLLQLCGLSVPTPKEFDDPNSILQGLMQVRWRRLCQQDATVRSSWHRLTGTASAEDWLATVADHCS